MSYVKRNLVSGEEIVHTAKAHWFIFLPSITLGAVGTCVLAIDRIAAHSEACSLACSRTMRTARSRSSAGYGFTGFFVVSMAPSSQTSGPPGNPARFTDAVRRSDCTHFGDGSHKTYVWRAGLTGRWPGLIGCYAPAELRHLLV